jgi:outer membrane immunogenic protein
MIKKTLLVGLVVSSFAVAAHAGVYVNAGAGIGGMDTKKEGSYKLRSGVAGRAAIGYLMGESNFNYGAELGYTGYPNNTYTEGGGKLTYSGHYVDLLGVGKYNFSQTQTGFFVVGKAGIAVVSQQTKVTGVFDFNKTKSAVKPELAVGGGYNVNKNVAVDVTLAHVFGSQANPYGDSESAATKVSSVNTLMAGITYNFS